MHATRNKGTHLASLLDGTDLQLADLVPLPCSMQAFPEGWLSPWELTAIYNYALVSTGPILEIGSWIGRSSTAIAMGLRDQSTPGDAQVLYDIVDFGITSGQEWTELLGQPFKNFCEQDQIARSIHALGGSIALLIDNLRKNELLPYVTSIIRANVLSAPLRDKYALVFCDTLHDEREIHLYGPTLKAKCKSGAILICDDIVDKTLGNVLSEYINIDSMFYLRTLDSFVEDGNPAGGLSPKCLRRARLKLALALSKLYRAPLPRPAADGLDFGPRGRSAGRARRPGQVQAAHGPH